MEKRNGDLPENLNAGKVRKLAEESRRAAGRIDELNDRIKSATESAVKAVQTDGTQSNPGGMANAKVLTTLEDIQTAAKEAEMLVRSFNESIGAELDSASLRKIHGNLKESTAGVDELAGIVEELSQLMRICKKNLQREAAMAASPTNW